MKTFALLLLTVFAFVATPAGAQDFQQGFAPFQAYDNGQFDSINLGYGNLFANIPLISYSQRGTLPDFGYSLGFNNETWVDNCYYDDFGHLRYCQITPSSSWAIVPNQTGPGVIGELTYGYKEWWSPSIALDASGATHNMYGTTSSGWPTESPDATGIHGVQNVSTSSTYTTDKNGITSVSGFPISGDYQLMEIHDPTGNTITANYSSTSGLTGFTDSIGRSIPPFPTVTSAGCASSSFPGPPGSSSVSIQACYSSHTVQSNVGCGSSCIEYSGTSLMLDSVTLPNSTTWSFGYDTYGDLTSVTLPTGGVISYGWALPSWVSSYFGTTSYSFARQVTSRTVVGKTWTYAYSSSTSSTTTVTDPDGNVASHTFNVNNLNETEVKYYSGSSTLLKTIDKTYFGYTSGVSGPIDFVPKTITTTWPSGKVNEVCLIYDDNTNTSCTGTDAFNSSGPSFPLIPSGSMPLVYGTLLYKYEYDYGSGSPGSLLRETTTNYLWQSNSTYLNQNFLNLPSSVTVANGGGSTAAETVYSYDESGSASSGCSSSSPCGELTTASRYVNSSSHLNTHYHYGSYGMKSTMIDPAGNATSYSYDSTGAYLAQIQYPSTTNCCGHSGSYSHNELSSYDSNTGLLTLHTGQNGNVTSYGYDSIRRLTSVSYPDGGSDSYTYSDTTSPPYVDFTKSIDASTNFVQRGIVDGLGRPTQTRTIVPGSTCIGGYSYVDTAYDNEGRKSSGSNSYCSTGDTTYGVTTYHYDPLNRVTIMVPPDGTTSSDNVATSFTGNCSTTIDEAGKARKSCVDGLGRITGVWEDPAGLNYETDYSYDTNDNLTGVSQVGSRTRTFNYDWLSRLTSATNPESGTTTYTYDADGNILTKLDARGITTSYTYDALNRLQTKWYSDNTSGPPYNGTPSPVFYYDEPNGSLTRLGYLDGTLTWNGAILTTTGYSYDSMGRLNYSHDLTPQFITATPAVPWDEAYTYNFIGGITSYRNFATAYGTISQSFDVTGEVSAISSNWNDSQHPTTLANGIEYNAPGQQIAVSIANGLTQTAAYDNRLQPCRMNVNSAGTILNSCTAATPSSNVLDLTAGFGNGSSDNGSIVSWSAVGAQTFSRTYSPYDGLNRLTSLTDSVSSFCPGLSWTYDAWGNRTAQSVTSGSCTSWSAGYNSSNHITNTGYTYDADGNVTNDGSHSYTYDAENRLICVDSTDPTPTCLNDTSATAVYIYDALGRRVQKTTGGVTTNYFYDEAQGNVLEEYSNCTTCGTTYGYCYSCFESEYIYLNNQLFAEYNSSGTVFSHPDHLGSTRLLTDLTGCVVDNLDYLPFGQLYSNTTSCSTQDITHKFTDKERDSESNLDNFGARYMSSAQGRFMSPDWSAIPAPVPYADFSDPQTLNLYSYVGDNPLSLVDPDGHCDDPEACGMPAANSGTVIHVDSWSSTSCLTDFQCMLGLQQGAYLSNFSFSQSRPQSQSLFKRLVNSAVCTVAKPLTSAAKGLNGTVGAGIGGSAGIGFIAGVAASAGVQLVADNQGNVGVAFNVGGNPGYGVFGIGATAGAQGAYSTSSSIYGLRGFSIGGGVTAGPGGVDVAFGSSGVTATGTFGAGAGTKGAALSLNYTWVPAVLSTNCNQ